MSMMLPDLELYDSHPEWRPLLAAYQERLEGQKTPWTARIVALDAVAPEQLSPFHGKLIALGLLKFEIGNGAEGVQYQVTPLGRQALLPPESRQITPEWLLTADTAESSAA